MILYYVYKLELVGVIQIIIDNKVSNISKNVWNTNKKIWVLVPVICFFDPGQTSIFLSTDDSLLNYHEFAICKSAKTNAALSMCEAILNSYHQNSGLAHINILRIYIFIEYLLRDCYIPGPLDTRDIKITKTWSPRL